MKYCLITSGKILETISDDQLWIIEIVTEEERKKRCYQHTARISSINLIETYEKRDFFEKIRDVVDGIWSKSSDIKDFAKRLCDAYIADRVFEQVEIQSKDDE